MGLAHLGHILLETPSILSRYFHQTQWCGLFIPDASWEYIELIK